MCIYLCPIDPIVVSYFLFFLFIVSYFAYCGLLFSFLNHNVVN